jgi:cyclomaltodextrinase
MTLETRNEGNHLLIALNLDDAGSVQPAPGIHNVVAGSGTVRQPGTPKAQIELAPHGWAILAAASG